MLPGRYGRGQSIDHPDSNHSITEELVQVNIHLHPRLWTKGSSSNSSGSSSKRLYIIASPFFKLPRKQRFLNFFSSPCSTCDKTSTSIEALIQVLSNVLSHRIEHVFLDSQANWTEHVLQFVRFINQIAKLNRARFAFYTLHTTSAKCYQYSSRMSTKVHQESITMYTNGRNTVKIE